MATISGHTVRPATNDDLPRMMDIFAQARETMRADGNLTQWAGEYPSAQVVLEDIRLGRSFVIEEDGAVVGTFAFIQGVEPTYARIYKCEFTDGAPVPLLATEPLSNVSTLLRPGRWLDDTLPYATIHRLAGARDSHGIAQACFNWAWQRCRKQSLNAQPYTLRVDTHADNHIMQHCIQKAGFTYCGIIYLADGAPRLAYQKNSI